MKKILSVAAAIALAASIISCGDSSDEFSGAVDTVITISAPSVTGKAYPGVNYITWEPVVGAGTYELYRSDDGDKNVLLTTVTPATNATLGYADIAANGGNSALTIADGKTYKYTVLAIGANATAANVNVPSRDVYLKGNKSSVSVKAIVPAAGTSVGDFAAYKSFFQKFDEKNLAKNVVITKTQDVKADGSNWGGFYVTFPATAGLEFGLAKVDNTGIGANGEYIGLDTINPTLKGNYKENFTANAAFVALGSGKKDLYVKIGSVASSLYQPIVKKVGDVTIEGINEVANKETRDVTAKYRTATTAEVYWKPAVLAETNKETATSNYIVYRTTSADNYDEYTVVAGVEGKPAITAKKVATTTVNTSTVSVPNYNGNANVVTGSSVNDTTVDVVYSFTDTITDNTATYKYYVVHKSGNYYGKAATAAELTKFDNAPATPSIVEVKQVTKAADDKTELQIFAKKANVNQTLTLTVATLASDYNKAAINTFTDFTGSVKLENYAGDNLTYVAYFKGDYNTNYVFKLTATETGKEGETSVYTAAKVGPVALNGEPPTVKLQDDDNATDLKYVVVVSDPDVQTEVDNGLDSFENYTYTLYSVTTSADRYFENYITVTEENLGAVTLSALTEANKTKYSLTGNTKEDATADASGNTKAKFYGINSVTAPKPTDDANGKYSSTKSVRFYVVKTVNADKTVSSTTSSNTLGAFNNIQVK